MNPLKSDDCDYRLESYVVCSRYGREYKIVKQKMQKTVNANQKKQKLRIKQGTEAKNPNKRINTHIAENANTWLSFGPLRLKFPASLVLPLVSECSAMLTMRLSSVIRM